MIYAVIIISQLLFLSSDILARHYMSSLGFHLSTFIAFWFLAYTAVRFIASVGQLYVFSNFELGKTMTLFGAVSLVLANLAGYFLLGEVLSVKVYVGVMLAVSAFIVIAIAK